MTSNEAVTIAYKRVADALQEFRTNQPGPYLDLGCAGMTHRYLVQCEEDLRELVTK